MKSQLCWSCKSKKCPWRRSLTPVEGWTAKPTMTEDGLRSYQVTKCPLYEHWDRTTEEDLKLHSDIVWDIQEIDENILTMLPQKYQDIIKARFVGRYSQREIATMFKIRNQSMARAALHKAVDAYYEAKYKSLGYNISFSKKKIKKLNSKALAACPKEFQTVLNMKYRDNLRLDDICTKLNLTVDAFCYTLKRAKRYYFGELVKVLSEERS